MAFERSNKCSVLDKRGMVSAVWLGLCRWSVLALFLTGMILSPQTAEAGDTDPAVARTLTTPGSDAFSSDHRAWVQQQPRTFDNENLFQWDGSQLVRADHFRGTSDVFGDFDGDFDVDIFDYQAFQICQSFSGPALQSPPACDVFDIDSDWDIDLIDTAAFMEAYTGRLGGVVVEAGELRPITSLGDTYYSGEPGTFDNNALNGIAAQAGYTQDNLWYEWSAARPVGSGGTILSNASLPATAYTLLSPVLDGPVVFTLVVTNLVTLEVGLDAATLNVFVPECVADADCDDGLFCNGTELCDLTDPAAGVCVNGAASCTDQQVCDEDNDLCHGDRDQDGIPDFIDNCPDVASSDQADGDHDGVGDVCDACPIDPNNDADGDGICGDVDSCPNDPDNDADGDGICGDVDNCPAVANANQADFDDDGVGDLCDNCPTNANADQADDDSDGVGNGCDDCPDTVAGATVNGSGCDETIDSDNDGVLNGVDNCKDTPNPGQENADGDDFGDACDACPEDPDNDADRDGLCVGVCDLGDCRLCQNPNNPRGWEFDCCPNDPSNDVDFDGVCGDVDPCPNDPRPDEDGDGLCGDVDLCPHDPNNDADGDGICGDVDVCPNDANDDADGDGICGDVDICPNDPDNDLDMDGVCGDLDLCLSTPVAERDAVNADGCGPSERDTDGDGVTDDLDLCPGTAPGTPVDADGCPPQSTIGLTLPVADNMLLLAGESININYEAQVFAPTGVPATVTLTNLLDTDMVKLKTSKYTVTPTAKTPAALNNAANLELNGAAAVVVTALAAGSHEIVNVVSDGTNGNAITTLTAVAGATTNISGSKDFTTTFAALTVCKAGSFTGKLTVNGSSAADTIEGGSGADTIEGEAGGDTLTGNGGADVFTYTTLTDSLNTALDTLMDFTSGTDKLDVPTPPRSLVPSTGVDVTVLAAVPSTGTTTGTLATDIGTANAAAAANAWDQVGDVCIVQITGASVGGTDVYYMIIEEGTAAAAYNPAADAVIQLGAAASKTFVVADFK